VKNGKLKNKITDLQMDIIEPSVGELGNHQFIRFIKFEKKCDLYGKLIM
jgi:hypothetical protein